MKSIKTLAFFLFVACFASCSVSHEKLIGNPSKGAVLVSFEKDLARRMFCWRKYPQNKNAPPSQSPAGKVFSSSGGIVTEAIVPGTYEFYLSEDTAAGYVGRYFPSFCSILFNVHPGKLTYIGQLNKVGTISYSTVYEARDHSQKDIAEFLAKNPKFSRNDIVIDLMKPKGANKKELEKKLKTILSAVESAKF